MAPVRVGNKWGFIKSNGRMMIAPKYDWVEPFVDGFAVVVTGEVKEFTSEYGGEWHLPSDPTTYIIKNSKWGFVDRYGNLLNSTQFDGAWFFQDNIAAVKIGSKWGFINRAGRIIVKPTFDDVHMSFDRRYYLMAVEIGEKQITIHSVKELFTHGP